MDPETVAELRNAHESSVMLLTLLMEGNTEAAAEHVFRNPHLFQGPTCIATANIAVGAIKTLAQMTETDPSTFTRIVGLNSAQAMMNYEKENDSDEGEEPCA